MKNNPRLSSSEKIIQRVLSEPSYKGKHIIMVNDKIFTARSGEGAAKILKIIRKRYPGVTPAIAYIPDADTLILFV